MSRPTSAPSLVRVADVAAAHGVRGALRLRCYTEQPENVAAYGPLLDARGRDLFTVQVIGAAKGGVIVRVPGITDRDAAEALKGTALFVQRDALPAPQEDEYYHADLVGLRVEDASGAVLGRVRAVHDHGAGDLLEIVLDDGGSLDLPFTRAVVPLVDVAGGRVVVVPTETIAPQPSGEGAAA